MGDSHKPKRNTWPIKAFVVTIILTVLISLLSDIAIGDSANIVVVATVLLVLIVFGIVSDMVGVAVTSTDAKPFVSMAAKRVPGAQRGLWLIKHADRVSSVCNDVIGDICGIVSGVASTAMTVIVIAAMPAAGYDPVSIGVSAVIAGVTVFGKAIGKNAAIRFSREIVLTVGRVMALFKPDKKNGSKR